VVVREIQGGMARLEVPAVEPPPPPPPAAAAATATVPLGSSAPTLAQLPAEIEDGKATDGGKRAAVGGGGSGDGRRRTLAELFKAVEELRLGTGAVGGMAAAAADAVALADYSVCQTTLEQIFNAFARQQREERGGAAGLMA
jgi:hypothetical protein